jgi:Asp-tRNA(Asn)/Glu-tRNA(Gln) amidotransferase B subunit
VQSSGFFIILKAIIKAIKEGKISKAMGRLLVRRMLKERIYVDPE